MTPFVAEFDGAQYRSRRTDLAPYTAVLLPDIAALAEISSSTYPAWRLYLDVAAPGALETAAFEPFLEAYEERIRVLEESF